MKLSELVNFVTPGKKDKQKDPENSGQKEEGEAKEEEHVDRATKIKVIVALMVVGFAVYVAWWVQEPGSVRADLINTMESTAETMETSQATQEISFVDFALEPAVVTVEKGTTVIWTNKDTVPHTVTGSIFTSGTLDRGQSYSFTFMEDGTYEYHCSYHPQITGKIIVGAGGETMQTEEMGLLTGTEEILPEATGNLFPAAGEETAPVPALYADNVTAGETVAAENTVSGEAETVASAEEIAAANLHEAAVKNKKLASSGPEDFLYAGAFAVILFLNRRKLLAALK